MSASVIRPAGQEHRAATRAVDERAAGFERDRQGEALQAFAFGDAPRTGRLVCPRAFASL
ncbi:hypothetical protein [Aquibium microcysteis]|uniref:hypothetical protein n=1 Tax=Aquibium microcysteis TaxID=675281 RepID=UPI00165D261B|nr:hypothetical protein [Aquibium microcysteis]